jgi:TRAP-type transport system periplasmic protein
MITNAGSGTRAMRKFALFALLLPAMALPSLPSHGAQYEFRVGHNGGIDHPFQRGFEKFKQIVEQRSNGRISVTIYPGGQLGAEDKVNVMIRIGLVAAQATSAAAGLSPFVPDIDALNYPFLFRDLDHYYRVMDGAVGRQLAKEVEDRLGVVFLGWGFSGVRSVWNRERPIVEPEDMRNMKLRVINSRMVIDAFTAFGAQATPMAFSEVYNALQQGVIDGAETDDIDLMVEKFYEVAKYVSLTNHLYLAAGYVFSKRVFDRLPSDLQQIVRDAGSAATMEERQAMAEQAATARDFLKRKGLKFNQVDTAKFRLAVSGLDHQIESPEVAALVQRIEAQ